MQNELYVRTWGVENPANTKTALLLHGLASSSEEWIKYAKQLKAEGYKVYAPDLPGHGKSPRMQSYSPTAMLNQLKTVITKYELANIDLLVGHSLGGLFAANLHKSLNPKKTVLVEPVFHLPKNRILLIGIQRGFMRVIFAGTAIQKYKSLAAKRAVKRTAAHSWDVASRAALTPYKKDILRILASDSKVLLLRAQGSFVAPARLSRRQLGEKVKVISMKGGHNFHRSRYESFANAMNEFTKVELITV